MWPFFFAAHAQILKIFQGGGIFLVNLLCEFNKFEFTKKGEGTRQPPSRFAHAADWKFTNFYGLYM